MIPPRVSSGLTAKFRFYLKYTLYLIDKIAERRRTEFVT
jgi:hypothetical protein